MKKLAMTVVCLLVAALIYAVPLPSPTPSPTGSPPPEECLQTAGQGHLRVRVSWNPNPPEENILHYDVYRGLETGFYPDSITEGPVQATETHKDFLALDPSCIHYFVVTATNAEGESDPSQETSIGLPTFSDSDCEIINSQKYFTITYIVTPSIEDKVTIETTHDFINWESASGDLLSRVVNPDGTISIKRGFPFDTTLDFTGFRLSVSTIVP